MNETSANAGQAEHVDDEGLFVDQLKPGTTLLQGQYTIKNFINAGGFGITYLAKNSLDRDVVIKECFPGSFCRRTRNSVTARSRAHQPLYAQMVKLFVQEAKSLSRLVHPNIVGVHQVFEDYETAYMVIDYVDGRDLLETIKADRAGLMPAQIVSMLKKLLGAVGFIHDNGMLHRDISPDNILVNSDGEPILIDFGAARQQATKIGGKVMSALRVVKDGYSPQEFYISGSVQDASSDLYALAATFYHAITGAAPPDSQARLVAIAEGGEDPYVPVAGRFDEYPASFLEALDQAVSVLPRERIASAREWLDRIAAEPGIKVVPLKSHDGGRAEDTRGTEGNPAAVADPAEAEKAEVAAEITQAGVLPPLPIPQGDTPKHSDGSKIGLKIAASVILVAGLGYAALQTVGTDVIEEQTGTTALATIEVPAAATAVDMAQEASISAPAVVGEPRPEEETAADAVVIAAAGRADPVAATGASEVEGAAGAETSAEPAAEPQETVVPAAGEMVAALPALAEVPEAAAPVEPAATARPVHEVDQSVASQQIYSAVWEVTLPFNSRTTTAAGRFPQITEVLPVSGDAGMNSWVAEGVTIYAVGGTWVADQQSIEDRIRSLAKFDADQFVFAPARIKTDATAPFSEVTLAVPVMHRVTLANGVQFVTTPVDGKWQTAVFAMADPVEEMLQVGDILLS